MKHLRKHLLLILLFGTLIGLQETIIGSFDFQLRPVVLSTFTLLLLMAARYSIRSKGSSILVILIAVLFKINTIGVQSCDTNVLLCGPTALFLLGLNFEIFSGLFTSALSFRPIQAIKICLFTAFVSFAMFGLMNTFILMTWETETLFRYILVSASLTLFLSGGLSVFMLILAEEYQDTLHQGEKFQTAFRNMAKIIIFSLWILGTVSSFQ